MKIIFRLMDCLFINRIRKNLIKHLFKYHINLNYDCAEFGVYKGTTARYIAEYCGSRTLFLFDSFDGLPEDWNKNFKKGDFRLKELPQLNFRAILYKGLFAHSLSEFKRRRKDQPFSFIHIDSDLYSSAKEILFRLNKNIVNGTVILFDEYEKGENLAFQEWSTGFSRKVILLKKTVHLQAAYMVMN